MRRNGTRFWAFLAALTLVLSLALPALPVPARAAGKEIPPSPAVPMPPAAAVIALPKIPEAMTHKSLLPTTRIPPTARSAR